jgi:hypothetical protein
MTLDHAVGALLNGEPARENRLRSARRRSRPVPSPALWIIGGAALFSLLARAVPEDPFRRQAAVPATAAGSGLEMALARAADYCDRLDRSVLDFVCRERIEEWFRPSAQPAVPPMRRAIFLGARVDHDYIYDYQLVRGRQGHITESRTLLKEDGKKVSIPDAPLKTHSFTHAKVVMGPLGLLSRKNQVDHDYRLVREDRVRGEEALVVEAVPKPGVQFPHLFGRLWLRKRDAGILKIEWNPASIGNYQIVEKTAKFLGLTPDLLIISEYAFEKNGIRFPSRYTVKEIYRRGTTGAKYAISQIDVFYDQYKFFTVETEVEIQRGGERR